MTGTGSASVMAILIWNHIKCSPPIISGFPAAVKVNNRRAFQTVTSISGFRFLLAWENMAKERPV